MKARGIFLRGTSLIVAALLSAAASERDAGFEAKSAGAQVRRLASLAGDIQSRLGGAGPGEARLLRRQAREALAERRLHLVALIEQAPAEAIASALDADAVAALAAAFPDAAADLETAGRFQGEVEYLIADDFATGRAVSMIWMKLGSERVRVHFADRVPADLRSGAFLTVDGIRLGDRIAATSGVVSPASGTVSPMEAALTCSSTGDQRIAVLLVDFPGNPLPPVIDPPFARNVFFGLDGGRSVDGFWREASYGRATASGDVFGPFQMSRSFTCDETAAMRAFAIAAADPYVDFRQYDRLFIIFPNVNGCFFAGLGELNCSTISSGDGPFSASTSWLHGGTIAVHASPRDFAVFAASHEGGHNLGLLHANFAYYGSDVIGVPGTQPTALSEYLDPYSAMGRYTYGHYAAPHKVRLGWLDPVVNVRTVTSSGTHILLPYEPASTGIQALKVQRGNDPTWLWLESRTNQSPYDCQPGGANCDGALAHYEEPYGASGASYILDFTPNTSFNLFDATLVRNRGWTDPYTGLSFAVSQGAGGLDVAVTYATPTCHRPPVITLPTDPLSVGNGASLAIPVTVTNVDQPSCPQATYDLSASPAAWAGVFQQNPLSVSPGTSALTTLTITAPASTETGSYDLTVEAAWTTARGSATKSVSVSSTCTLSDPNVHITPDTQGVAVNEQATFLVNVTSTDSAGCGSHAYSFSTTMPAGGSGTLSPGTATMRGGDTRNVTMRKFFPASAVVGQTYTVDFIATSVPGLPSGSPHVGSDTADLTALAACVRANPSVTFSPEAGVVQGGAQADLTMTMRSNDSPTCSRVFYSAGIFGPSGWDVWLDLLELCIPGQGCRQGEFLAPGESIGIPAYATPPTGTPGGVYTVTGTSTQGSYTASGSTRIGVEPVCVRVDPSVVLTPATTATRADQTASLTVTVTNNDLGSTCQPVAFALAPILPAGWTASLGALAAAPPGGSASAPFYVTPPVTAGSGPSSVGVRATAGTHSGTGYATVNVQAVCRRGSGPTVTLVPGGQSIDAGQTASFEVVIVDTDVGAACTGYSVVLQSTQPATFAHAIVPSSPFIPPGGTLSAILQITPPVREPGGSYPITVTALRGNTIGDDSTGYAVLTVAPVCARFVPTVTLSPASVTVEASATAVYTVAVTNNDTPPCGTGVFTISSSQPAGWGTTISAVYVTIDPGARGYSTLLRTPPIGTIPGTYTVDALATTPSVTGSGTAACQVTAPTLKVALSVPSPTVARNTVVPITAFTQFGVIPQAGATVTYRLTLPGGSVKTFKATSGSDGKTVWKHKAGTRGTYSVTATSAWSGKTATSQVLTFTAN